MHVLGIIGIAAVILAAVLYAFAAPLPALPNEAQAVGYRLGRLFAIVILPFLVAYPVAGRRKARNPNLFAGVYCGIGLFILLANAAASLPASSFHPETADEKVARLMREAAGLQPVRKPIFGEGKTDTKLRDLFQQIIVLNKDYQAAVSKVDMSAIGKLNTSESFADPESAAYGLTQLHAAYDLDVQQEQHMREMLENFQRGFNDLSTSDRESMLKSFSEGLGKVMPTRQRAVATEKTWVDAMDAVYSYAQANHSQFQMSGDRLLIADEQVRQEFNDRIHAMNDRRKEFLQAKSDFDRLQGQTLHKTGITRDQTGLH
jgi:hypothetical protein